MPYANKKGTDQPARFESYLVKNPKDRFSRDMAQFIFTKAHLTDAVVEIGKKMEGDS